MQVKLAWQIAGQDVCHFYELSTVGRGCLQIFKNFGFVPSRFSPGLKFGMFPRPGLPHVCGGSETA